MLPILRIQPLKQQTALLKRLVNHNNIQNQTKYDKVEKCILFRGKVFTAEVV